jgi:prepilin-type processing-associated H-X9-DG protein
MVIHEQHPIHMGDSKVRFWDGSVGKEKLAKARFHAAFADGHAKYISVGETRFHRYNKVRWNEYDPHWFQFNDNRGNTDCNDPSICQDLN